MRKNSSVTNSIYSEQKIFPKQVLNLKRIAVYEIFYFELLLFG